MALALTHPCFLALTLVIVATQVEACSGDTRARDAGQPATTDDDSSSSDDDMSSSTSPSGAADAMSNTALDAGRPNVDAGTAGPHAGDSLAPDAAPRGSMTSSGDAGTFRDDSPSPAASDFGAKGPFADAKMFPETGPNSTYVLYRPDTSLGNNGFKHPIGAWGNGLVTTPDQFQEILTLVASHGFVVIGCPDIVAEEPCLTAGLEWLVEQNAGSGPLAGKLDTSREFSLGYSWGGGAAIDVSTRPNMKATISLHGMPPRNDPWGSMHAPLVLFGSTGDTLVPADQFVTQNYNSSQVQTFFATLQDPEAGHFYVLDTDSFSCGTGAGEVLALGTCTGASEERAPSLPGSATGSTGTRVAATTTLGTSANSAAEHGQHSVRTGTDRLAKPAYLEG